MKKFLFLFSLVGLLFLPLWVQADLGDFGPKTGLRTNGIPTSYNGGNGTNNVQFNLFNNSYPYKNFFDVPHLDERDFITAAKTSPTGFANRLNGLQMGDKVIMQVYVHNNAQQVCGGGNNALNTEVIIDWSDSENVVGRVSASNASPTIINDIVGLRFLQSGLTLSPTNAYVKKSNVPDGVPVPDCGESRLFFDHYDFPSISYTQAGDTSLRVNLGDVPASFGNAQAVWVGFDVIEAPAVPSIQIVKTDLHTVDQDGVQRNDTQTINAGQPAKFEITVTNDGTETLRDIVVTDAEAPACARGASQTASLIATVGNNDALLDPNESFTYTCQLDDVQPNTFADGDNDAQVSGVGVGLGQTVNDQDPSVVVVNTTPPGCGNGVIEPPEEQCDDGNLVSGDGCSATCEIEGVCGDGVVETPEQCDDGNTESGDGCSATCEIEGFCGDGVIQVPEECDDGNSVDTDACRNNCTLPGGGGGGGGGSGSVDPSVGTCSFHAVTGAAQCTRRKPVEDVSDPLWQAFRECKDGTTPPRHSSAGKTLAELCAMDWAEDQGLILCGSTLGGGAPLDPFLPASSAEITAQCDQTVCTNCGGGPGGCSAVGSCPGCFHTDTDVVKTITSGHTVAKGENVTYRIDVGIEGFNNADYQIVDAEIRVYDIVVPSASGNIWDRKGIIDGDGNATWLWCDNNALCPESGEYFFMDLEHNGFYNYVQDLNLSGNTALEVHYDMDSNVASTRDTAQIKNVAFGMVYYTYMDRISGAFYNKVVGIGNGMCTGPAPTLQRIAQDFYGASETVNIIRPFVKARAGNAGYFGQGNAEKAFGDQEAVFNDATWAGDPLDPSDLNYGLTLTDDPTLYTGVQQGDALDLANFQDQQEAFYNNLNTQSSDNVTLGGVGFTKLPDTAVYQLDGDLDVTALGALSHSATFIVTNGDVQINSNFTLPPDVFAAFIVRDGDLLIDKNVSLVDGLYLVETGMIKSSPDTHVSTTQLQVQGNMYGNLGHLLAYRRYIGSGTDIQPSIEINFDLRLFDHTPPMLEQFLGAGWREEISE